MSEPRAIDEPRVITALHLLRDLGFTALYDAEENLAADIADILDAWDALTAQLAAANADGERFHLLAVEVLSNGMIVGGIDVSEEACHEAVSHGRKEPIDDDRVMAARIAVDALRLFLESPPADAALAVQP